MSTLFPSKLRSLQKRSENALSIFHKTVADIKGVNTEIEAEQQKLRDAISKKEKSHSQLEVQKIQNLKISDKIEQFLNS